MFRSDERAKEMGRHRLLFSSADDKKVMRHWREPDMHDFIIHGKQKDIVEEPLHELLHVRTGLAVAASPT